MQWADVTVPPKPRTLRQFAVLWLCCFAFLSILRVWSGRADGIAALLAGLALVGGTLGVARPSAIRWLFTAWMIAAFPIGWTVSRIALAIVFYAVFTPVGRLFRLIGRDALRLRRVDARTYWTTKAGAADVREYFRQS
jgi:hypothetical protein